ncbi:hypothetical protein [Egbenema bharatensis]
MDAGWVLEVTKVQVIKVQQLQLEGFETDPITKMGGVSATLD